MGVGWRKTRLEKHTETVTVSCEGDFSGVMDVNGTEVEWNSVLAAAHNASNVQFILDNVNFTQGLVEAAYEAMGMLRGRNSVYLIFNNPTIEHLSVKVAEAFLASSGFGFSMTINGGSISHNQFMLARASGFKGERLQLGLSLNGTEVMHNQVMQVGAMYTTRDFFQEMYFDNVIMRDNQLMSAEMTLVGGSMELAVAGELEASDNQVMSMSQTLVGGSSSVLNSLALTMVEPNQLMRWGQHYNETELAGVLAEVVDGIARNDAAVLSKIPELIKVVCEDAREIAEDIAHDHDSGDHGHDSPSVIEQMLMLAYQTLCGSSPSPSPGTSPSPGGSPPEPAAPQLVDTPTTPENDDGQSPMQSPVLPFDIETIINSLPQEVRDNPLIQPILQAMRDHPDAVAQLDQLMPQVIEAFTQGDDINEIVDSLPEEAKNNPVLKAIIDVLVQNPWLINVLRNYTS
ncbi:hypothetical protein H632_c745p0 [Helicosporidium sp. ATCC 50920]|nr:hypothetical protein H632_c745p0 [Helicosporidium sp. ATCC 50920]|eukprot:KDD75322.1 hypothetical protein H632_c745p0 [Helicosporidium sp. ATCC 50920]